MLTYLVRVVTPELLATALGSGDIFLNKFRATMPEDVKLAWLNHLRPALERWRADLEKAK